MEKIKRKKNTEISSEALNDLIVGLIQDKKGKEIVSLNLQEIVEAVTDYFIVCRGDSTTQVRAIVDYIEEEMEKKYGIKPYQIEGKNFGEWCLLDYGSVVVHVFTQEKRDFYQLEQLWCDAKIKEYKDVS